MMLLEAGPTRRDLLALAAAGAAAAAVFPRAAWADSDRIAEELHRLFGDRQPLAGRIRLDVPSIAENGLTVPLGFEVDSPMTDEDYVRSVHIFADGNPSIGVASFHFTPLSPKAAASIRMRLAKTQAVVAVAEMSGGEIYAVRKEVKVTIGGCGG